MKVSNLIGNRLKLKKDAVVHVGHPKSEATEMWDAGRITPTVSSWVERDGNIFYQFDIISKQYYLKHDGSAMEPVAEHGAAEWLENEGDSDGYNVTFGAIDSLFNIFKPENLITTIKWAMGILFFWIGWKIYDIGR